MSSLAEAETARVRRTVAEALRRLAGVVGGPSRLHLDTDTAPGAAAAEEARAAGWTLVPPDEADVVLRLDSGTAPPPFPRARAMAWIGPRRQEIQDPAFDVVARRPHRNHLTLNAWFAHHPWAARLPAGVRRRIQALWKALGLEDRVGSRIASVPCPDRTEVYLVRRGASVPSRFPGTSAADRSADLVATCGGLGHVPLAGATLASAVPVLAAYASWWIAPSEDHFRLWWGGIFLAASAGCLATERWAQRHYFARDPREVVLDETAGMALTLLFLPDGLRAASPGAVAGSMALAFLAFRFFDVFKVGVRWIDRRTDLPGGVLWDDLLAGVYAGCLTAGVTWLALRPGEAAGP